MDGSDLELAGTTRGTSGRRCEPRPRWISRHAVDRWSERVGVGLGARAGAELQRFLATGRRRPRPRHWTRAEAGPGTVFVYSAERPDVCVVVREGVAVTVLTRALCRRAAA